MALISDKQTFDIAISGASFAGLALARALTLACGSNLRIAIVEPAISADAVRADNRAFAIWTGARHVLQGLQVWPRIEPHAEPVRRIEITDSALSDIDRRPRLTFEESDAPETGQPLAHMVPAHVLHAALFETLSGHPALTWFAPATAVDVEADNASARLTLADGQQIQSALVVAADGRNSRLREKAGIETLGWSYEQTGIVATVKLEEPHEGVAIQHFLPGGPFAVLPVKNDRVCVTWSSAREEADRIKLLDDDAFLSELDQRIGGRFGELELEGERQSWPLSLKLPKEMTAHRFALLGDAAHGVHPVAGQGVNLALRDVAALAESIVDAQRLGFDAGDQSVLERYSRWRRFDTLVSSAGYDGLNQLFAIDGDILRAGRGAGMSILDRLPSLKRMLFEASSGVSGDTPKLLHGALP